LNASISSVEHFLQSDSMYFVFGLHIIFYEKNQNMTTAQFCQGIEYTFDREPVN